MPANRLATVVFTCLVGCGAASKDWPRDRAEEPQKTDTFCAHLGEGYTRAPGSDTCVKLGGHVRMDGAVLWTR
jgi:hypothetical protein